MEAWKTMVPHWCKTPKNWEGLCDIYGTVEYQALSQRNQTNRCASGLTISHYSGSKSSYRHAQDLKKLLGREPTAQELFVHLHVGRENGQSLVVNQAIAALMAKGAEMDALREENDDGDELNTEEEEVIADIQTYEATSLQFANSRTQQVFEKANEMMLDPANEGREAIELFRAAAAKKSHGRDWGFGSNFEDSMPKAPTPRAKASCSNYVLTTEVMEECNAEFKQMLEDQNARFTEEIDKRDKTIQGYEARFIDMAEKHASKQVELQSMIHQLYVMIGMQTPTYQGQGSTSAPFQGAVSQQFQGAAGMHVPFSQGHSPMFQQAQGGVGINVPFFQDNNILNYGALLGMQLHGSQMPTSQGLGLQSMVAQASSSEAAMQWSAELDNAT